MTSSTPLPWPWMAGHSSVIPDPIPPISPNDNCPSVKDLIRENRSSIDDLKKELIQNGDSLFEPNKHDDLWLVRFLLSHKNNIKSAAKAARHAMEFRKKFRLDEKDIRSNSPSSKDCPHPVVQSFLKYCDDDTFRFAMEHPQGPSLIGFAKIRGYNQHEIVAHHDENQWIPRLSYISEWAFQWLDYITRTTGRVTKTIRIADVEGVSLSMFNLEHSRREGKSMNFMEDCYPQMLEIVFVVNPPRFIHTIWEMLKRIVPKRVVEKFDIVMSNNTNNDKGQENQRIFRYISAKELPIHLGGENEGWPPTPESYL